MSSLPPRAVSYAHAELLSRFGIVPDLEEPAPMTDLRDPLQIWLREHGAPDAPPEKVIGTFSAKVRELYQLDLVTNWNPSSCVFDARWQHAGRAAEGIEKPFSAEAQDAAQLLACTGLLRLLQELHQQ